MKTVIEIASEQSGIPVKELLSKSRLQKYSHVRQIVSYICKHTDNITLKDIAKIINRTHHTTILTLLENHEYDMMNKDYAELFTKIHGAYLQDYYDSLLK
ncbi:MAG: hypothetical protein EOM11_09960 [Erysipelotrichia bacterium]|nr:hypothetical protein [Erysipelotrichia bacterium]